MQLIPRPQRHLSTSKQFGSDLGFESPPPTEMTADGVFTHQHTHQQLSSAHPSEDLRSHPTLIKPSQDRVAIFIDGSNLFYAAMQLSLEIDYAKLLHCLLGERRLMRAYFYTGIDRSNEKQQGFLLWMRRHGYRVVTKDLVQHPDGSKRANLDVEMAVDMITLAHYCDTVILLSGDGDLAYAVNTIAYQGTQVEVVSLQSMTSDSLINVADRYTDLSSLRSEIQRSESPRPELELRTQAG